MQIVTQIATPSRLFAKKEQYLRGTGYGILRLFRLFWFYPLTPERLCSLFRVPLTPELGDRIITLVIIPGPDPPVPRVTLPQFTQLIFSRTSHFVASDCEVKMNWSTQKKIRPPIRLAIIMRYTRTIYPADKY